MHKLSTYMIFFFLLTLSCQLFEEDLERVDITNFENTFTQAQYDDQPYAGFYQNEAGNYFTALLRDSAAWLIEISREGEWIGERQLSSASAVPDALRHDRLSYVLIQNGAVSSLLELDGQGQAMRSLDDIDDFVEMNYNAVDSIVLNGMDYDNSRDEILLTGYVSTFGRRLTVVIGVDPVNLEPIWLRTHVFDGVAHAVHSLRGGKYVVSGIKNGSPFVYMDNRQGSAFQNQLRPDFQNTDYFHVDGTDNTVVIHGAESDGSRVVIFNEDLVEFTSRTIPVGNSLIRTSVTNPEAGELVVVGAGQDAVFLNQLERGTLFNHWCNQFWDVQGLTPLNLIKDEEIGYVILSMTPDGHVHLIKTDVEGATRNSPYSKECL